MKKSTSKTKHILLGVADSPLLPVQNLAEKIKLSGPEAQQLKRDLLTRAIQREAEYLFSTNFVRAIRPDAAQEIVSTKIFHKKKPLEGVDVSFSRFFYDHYIAKFPFLINTDLPKFLDKLEKFQDEVIKANLSSDAERSETTKRKLIILRLQKLLVLLYNNAIPIVTEGLLADESSPQEVSPKGFENNPISPTLPKEEIENMCGVPHLIDIVGVRVVTVKGAFRLSNHAKFIIRISKRENDETVYSFKRFDDFKALLIKMRKKFPLLELPVLPSKITSQADSRLVREQDRMNIRSTIRRLMANPDLAGCTEIYQFFTSDVEQLSDEDKEDIATRKSHMMQLAEDRKKYLNYLTSKAMGYKALWATCKEELVKPGGLNEFEEMLRKTSQVKDLPSHYLGALEWGRLNFASFLYTFFCTTDDSARFFQSLCSAHKMIPYRALATTLRFTNPTGMAKAVMDLLLAQPFGSSSLMQRLLTANLSDQARDAAKEIDNIERRIEEDALCQRIRNYVYFPEQRSEELVEGVSDFERLTIIINDPQIQPELTPASVIRFCSARDWIDQLRAGKSPPVQTAADGALLYPEFDFLEGLHQLFVLHNRKRDAEKISELMFQGVTGELMKDLLSVFYGPLAQVYKDANISDFISKISLFIDDLIAAIQQVTKFQDNDPKESAECGKLQHFLDLVERHEQTAYAFIHSIYSSSSNQLFRNLLEWMDSFLTAIRNKVITDPIDMQALVDANISLLDVQPLKMDLSSLAAYQQRRKVRQMRNLRRKIVKADVEDGFGDLEQLINIGLDDPKVSSINFGFGSLAVEDLRELHELDSMQKMVSHDPVKRQAEYQAQVNADPSEPMLVWLNTSTENITPSDNHVTAPPTSTSENEDTPTRIGKFIAPKVIANISQEPYPEGIHTIPKLLIPFIESVRVKLRK